METVRPSGEEIEFEGLTIKFTQRASSDAAIAALDRALKKKKRQHIHSVLIELDSKEVPMSRSNIEAIREKAMDKLLSPFFNESPEINAFAKTDEGIATIIRECCDGLGEDPEAMSMKIVKSLGRSEARSLVWNNSGLVEAGNSKPLPNEGSKEEEKANQDPNQKS